MGTSMAEPRVAPATAELAWRMAVIGTALAATIAVVVAPRWEAFVHAQSYGEFGSIADEARRDADAERRVVTNRLEAARTEDNVRRWGTFLTLDRNTIRRSPSARENGFDTDI